MLSFTEHLEKKEKRGYCNICGDLGVKTRSTIIGQICEPCRRDMTIHEYRAYTEKMSVQAKLDLLEDLTEEI